MLPPGAARERLRIPGLLGPARADQLLADGVYPFRLARGPVEAVAERWLGLPAGRFNRTRALRGRLERDGLTGWRGGQAQALLDLERFYCRAVACAICPLGRLAGGAGRRPDVVPSPNR